jgi:RHS repeat-associated protein
MKFRILIFALVASVSAFGQGTPYLPTAHLSTTPINSVRTWSAAAPEQNGATLITRPVKDVQQVTSYFDGLGRPLQTVVKQGSLITDPNSPVSAINAVDLVTAVVYDALGREQYKFLPFAANSAGSNTFITDGQFKYNPFQQQATFAAGQYPGEAYYYSKSNFEASPLDRATDVYAPGDSWVSSEANSDATTRRNIATQYLFNEASDSVRIWVVSGSNITTGSIYAAGQLSKTVTIDEHKNTTVEYEDKAGRAILKKVQLSSSPAGAHYGWLCTYYVYDYSGQLRCILQPAAVEAINSNWTLTSPMVDELCFHYEYDQRNRMTVKKIPGAAAVYMVYDAKDRLVLTQDSNLRAQSKWLYTTYDHLNRIVSTGLWTSAQTHSYQLGAAYSANTYPSSTEISINGQELTYNFYDDYSWVLDILGSGYNYSTTDNAEFSTASNSTWPYPQALTQSTAVKGMLTGTRRRVLGITSFLYSVTYYDTDGRMIQTQSQNSSGGKDIITTQYSFSGEVLQTVLRHYKSGSNPQTHIVQSRLNYDEAGRLIAIEKKLNSTIGSTNLSAGWHTIAALEYDALGQMRKKTLSPSYSSGGLDTLTNTYNIRGWLTAINKGFVVGNSDAWFGMELGYDKNGYATFSNKQYNGNISATIWRTKGDGEKRKYDFGYDAANRLLKADFTQQSGSNWNVSAGIDYSMKMGDGSDPLTAYDGNGNIRKMWQKGWKLGGSTTIDSLIYKNNDYSNKLKYVRDGKNDPDSKLSDFKEPSQNHTDNLTSNTADYSYDGNGNMTADANKGISSISYNHLNLPDSIVITGKGSIKYIYDAVGTKLKKIVYESGKADKTTVYIGGCLYENDTLQLLQHEEGRIRLAVNTSNVYTGYAFDYFEKDHLGNVRVVLTEQKDTAAYPEASMETANLSRDTMYYSKVADTRVGKPTGYPNDTYTTPNDWVAKVGGSGSKVGPGIVLKVMAGDQFNIRVSSWYKTNGASPGTPASPINDLLAALISGISGAGKLEASALQGESILSDNVTSFLNSQSVISSRPKAYLNWILFDEQLKYVSTSSGFQQVPSESEYHHGETTATVYVQSQNGLLVNKSGYLYIYASNETPNMDVFFDNLQVTHIKGPLLEETHYYPFGLTMFGISGTSIQEVENNLKFNGKELNDNLSLNWYEYGFRNNYDPQIGRFHTQDPLASNYPYYTPYQFAGNEVPNAIDLDGLEPLRGVFNYLVQKAVQKPKGVEAKALGVAVGVGRFAEKTVMAPVNLIKNPPKVIMPSNAADNAVQLGMAVADRVDKINNGSTVDKSAAITETVLDVGAIAFGTKGLGSAVKGGPLPGVLPKEFVFADEATVVRGGVNTADAIRKGTATHPQGVTGVSVECGTCAIEQLAENVPHGQIGVTTVGKVRKAGGDVIKTSGKSPNHATMTGLTPEQASELLTPTIKNPTKNKSF